MSKLNVFVACPYTLFPLEDYKKVFEAVSKVYSVTFKFADEQITNQHILTKVANYIRDHDFSLFDITGWNPNVALELGIAVGLGKKYFIMYNQRIDQNNDAPSDIRGIDRIQYSSNSELESKLLLLIRQEIPDDHEKSESAFERARSLLSDTIMKKPGLRVAELAQEIHEDKAIVQSIIRTMLAAGDLKTKGVKKGTKYYSSDTDLRTVARK